MSIAEAAPAPGGVTDDTRTIGLVSLAHFNSHYLIFVLVPLLPLLKDEFDVSFTQLGLMLTVFFAASGVFQVVAGIFVDRVGPHRLLLGGVALHAAATLAMGFAPSFVLLFPLQFVAALGNSVYHPADLSILSHRVSHPRQGRAFAAHVMAGQIGFGVSPLVSALIATTWGWRAALVVSGIMGLVILAGLLANRAWLRVEERAQAADEPVRERPAAPGFVQILSLPVVQFGIAFFLLSTIGYQGVMTFAVAALDEGYGVVIAVGTVVVAMFQFGAIGGTLAGGFVADRARDHRTIAAVAAVVSGLLMLPVAHTGLPLPAIAVCIVLAGVFFGVTLPSRDLLVRRSAPPGALGKTFGTVYSGLDAGSLLAPLAIGPLLDHGLPQFLFLVGAISMVLAAFTVAGIRGGDG